MAAETLTESGAAAGFRHEALLYAGEEEFVDLTVPFIADGLGQSEPVMVAVSADKIGLLRANLGWDGRWVDFVDMAELGTNPGRIISAWRQFVHDNRDRPHLRGIGEPVWAERSPDELVECQHHEMLLNAAFPPERPWRLLCPYDTSALTPAVISEAARTHPFVQHEAVSAESAAYVGGPDAFTAAMHGPLPEPEAAWRELAFDAGSRSQVLLAVTEAAAALEAERSARLVLSVTEVLENSIRHGGGRGTARVWTADGQVVCEVRDAGHIHDSLVGRGLPARPARGRRGLWLVHEMCDLVQVRSSAEGTVVRMWMRAGSR